MDRYVPSRRDDPRPPPYRFGEDQGNALRGGDSYRPGNFSFRAQTDRPAPRFNEQPPPRQQRRPQTSSRQNDRDRRGPRPDRKPYYTRPPRPATSDRPLLQGQREPTPDQMEGMAEENARFRALEDMSDSDEAAMEMDSDVEAHEDSATSDEPPRKKTHLTNGNDVDGGEKPKWSNPDPYYVLPPTDDNAGKRKDVVQLIRKARAEAGGQKALTAESDDFISFNFGDAEEDNVSEASEDSIMIIEDPKQKFSHLDNLHPNRIKEAAPPLPAGPPPLIDFDGPPPPPPGVNNDLNLDVWPPPPPAALPSVKFKDKKRKFDLYASGKGVTDTWATKLGKNPTPWYTVDHSRTESAGRRLHKEICDFYDYVKPRDFEDAMRHDLVRRFQIFLDQRFNGATVAYFGSFAAGLHLPDADMDLVVMSSNFKNGRGPSFAQNKNMLRKFASSLTSARLAKIHSSCVIPSAKVPIVKYVDDKTGLKVDVSFENDTGVVANRTYIEWKRRYPAMPMIVALVKQFLLMRGLNEVHTGGLGGFSTTSLVVSLMQLMPQLQSHNMDPMENLGEIFMVFLDFYGNQFNSTTTGIELNPPRHFQKHLSRLKRNPNRPWALSIVDPNRPDNDISGGTSQIHVIFKNFSEAFDILRTRMADIRYGRNPHLSRQSILSSLYAGDYSSFELQRSRMNRLYTERIVDHGVTSSVQQQTYHEGLLWSAFDRGINLQQSQPSQTSEPSPTTSFAIAHVAKDTGMIGGMLNDPASTNVWPLQSSLPLPTNAVAIDTQPYWPQVYAPEVLLPTVPPYPVQPHGVYVMKRSPKQSVNSLQHMVSLPVYERRAVSNHTLASSPSTPGARTVSLWVPVPAPDQQPRLMNDSKRYEWQAKQIAELHSMIDGDYNRFSTEPQETQITFSHGVDNEMHPEQSAEDRIEERQSSSSCVSRCSLELVPIDEEKGESNRSHTTKKATKKAIKKDIKKSNQSRADSLRGLFPDAQIPQSLSKHEHKTLRQSLKAAENPNKSNQRRASGFSEKFPDYLNLPETMTNPEYRALKVQALLRAKQKKLDSLMPDLLID